MHSIRNRCCDYLFSLTVLQVLTILSFNNLNFNNLSFNNLNFNNLSFNNLSFNNSKSKTKECANFKFEVKSSVK